VGPGQRALEAVVSGSVPLPVLVTGGEGMLGRGFAAMAPGFAGLRVMTPGRDALDVRDPAAVMGWADRVRGGWIVHAAARVDVEGCAREPDAARETILGGTANVAALAEASGARLLYPQSFLTYDAASCPIPEDETPRPLHLYGELKLEAERLLAARLPELLVVRMAGFFGGEAADKNFVGRIIPAMHAAILQGETRFEVGTRVWQPTFTEDLALNCLLLMTVGAQGSFQMACRGEASFADVADVIVRALGWQERLAIERVAPAAVAASELGRRPDRAVLEASRLAAAGLDLQRDWAPTLLAYLQRPFWQRFRLEI
jgi:dTDP-4-dehydrorhamnose reductase